MAAIVTQTLVNNAKCYMNCVPDGMVNYLILAQLLSGGAVTDPQTLVTQANCLMCTLSPGMVPYLILAQLASGGVGNLTGSVNPNGTVTGAIGQIYTQVVGQVTTIWVNTDGGTTWT